MKRRFFVACGCPSVSSANWSTSASCCVLPKSLKAWMMAPIHMPYPKIILPSKDVLTANAKNLLYTTDDMIKARAHSEKGPRRRVMYSSMSK